MAKNTGKEYEQFVESIYQALTKNERFTTVERDVKVDSEDGPRQIDILLRTKVADLDLMTIIECKDHKRRIGANPVGVLHSKIMAVKASKGVLISSNGFTEQAKRYATRNGITLCHASDMNSVLKEIEIDIPIKIRHVIVHFEAKYEITFLKNAKKGSSFTSKDVFVDGLKVFDRIYDKIEKDHPNFPDDISNFSIPSKELNLPYTVKDSSGKKFALVTDVKVKLKIGFRYYYGHLSNVPDLASMHQYESDSTIFVLKAQDYSNIFSHRKTMTEFKSEDEIPSNYRITFNMIDYKFKSQMSKQIEKNIVDRIVKIKRRKN